MPKYKVLRKFNFPYAHRLSKHKGLCRNIHGHNWELQIQVSSETLDSNDMVIDFSDLKRVVNGLVCDKFDHALVLNSNDIQTYKNNKDLQDDDKIILIEGSDPTAEKMTENIYYMIQNFLSKNFDRKIEVDFVRIWENDKSMAEFSE